jgi:hypothetical protein
MGDLLHYLLKLLKQGYSKSAWYGGKSYIMPRETGFPNPWGAKAEHTSGLFRSPLIGSKLMAWPS